MLKAIVGWALNMRVLVLAAAAAMLVIGFQSARNAPLDVFPEFAPPLVEVQTEAPGLSSEEVDALVTVPLENNLNGLPFLQTIRSKSVMGLSSVVMIFQKGTDLITARQLVQERLNLAQGNLPQIARRPVLMAPYSSLSRVLKVGLTSQTLPQMELSELALWTIRPRLMSVPGVANVAIWGQQDMQYQILVDPERLRAANVTLDAIEQATQDASAIESGGFVDTPNQRLSVRQLGGIQTLADLQETVIPTQDGSAIRLGDVANVTIGHPAMIGDGVINDQLGILLIVEKEPWGNTLSVTKGVEKVLAELAPGLEGVEMDSTIFRPATFVQQSIDHLTEALVLGCLFVILVLALFLGNWRTTIISIIAIPLSLAVALAALHWQNQTINTMVLAGLIIALGEVVDDAIIDVENILRRLRLNQKASHPKPAFKVVLEASLEVRSAVVYASLIIVMVFVPVFFLPGLAGTFFRPLALAYMVAIAASLAVALTVTPALCLLLLNQRDPSLAKDGRLAARVKGWYRACLPVCLRHPIAAISTLGATFLFTGWIWLFQLGEEFLPNFKERDFLMHWLEKPNTSVEASRRITIAAAKDLLAVPGVRNHGAHIGRALVADEVVGPDFTELWISIDPEADYESTIAEVQSVVDSYPGLVRDLLTYLRERIKEVLTGASASVVIRIFGPELDELRHQAGLVQSAIQDLEGVTELKIESQSLVPHVAVEIDIQKAAVHSVTPAQIRRAVTTLIRARKVGEVYEDQRIHDVVIWSEPNVRSNISSFINLLIDTPQGGHVRLGDVANISILPTPNTIKRENASRRIDVTCNVGDRPLGDVVENIESRLATLSFPIGYHPVVLGEWAERQEAQRRLIWLSLAAVAGILTLLVADFKSPKLVAITAGTLPFALIGGVLAAWLSGGVLSLGSLVGFVTVLGIAARNGILLVSHYRHLEVEEKLPFGVDLVLRGSEERLLPILMTAATAALALLPLILKGNVPGNEIERPMAIVILGGLVTSTLLNLFILPSIFAKYGNIKVNHSVS
jgi:CzcA family heavy metal efflux pump